MGFVMIVRCEGRKGRVFRVGIEEVGFGRKTRLVDDGHVRLVALSDLGLILKADVWGSAVSCFERFL
jgi:hypothetical protein